MWRGGFFKKKKTTFTLSSDIKNIQTNRQTDRPTDRQTDIGIIWKLHFQKYIDTPCSNKSVRFLIYSCCAPYRFLTYKAAPNSIPR